MDGARCRIRPVASSLDRFGCPQSAMVGGRVRLPSRWSFIQQLCSGPAFICCSWQPPGIIKIYGGMGAVAQIVFLVGAFLLLTLLLFQDRCGSYRGLSEQEFSTMPMTTGGMAAHHHDAFGYRCGLSLARDRGFGASCRAERRALVRESNGHLVAACFGDPGCDVSFIDRDDAMVRYMEDKNGSSICPRW